MQVLIWELQELYRITQPKQLNRINLYLIHFSPKNHNSLNKNFIEKPFRFDCHQSTKEDER